LDENSIYLQAITFHSQQAAEKYCKALLVYHQVEFPKTHDLADLVELLATVDKVSAEKLSEIDVLNPYAIESRYPGDYPDISFESAKTAVELAELTRSITLQFINR
jgi:HEPN domain-containing protein